MRTFSLLLILANVLYFVWSQLLDAHVNALDRAPVARAAPPPRIVLAREAEGPAPNPGSEEIAAQPDPGSTPGLAAALAEETIEATAQLPVLEPATAEPATIEAADGARLAAIAGADTLACTTIGPFADLPQAAQAQAALTAAGFEPRQRVEQGELWVGYWVSVQDFATREAADEALRTLTARAITDVYVMPTSETQPSNALSLGVFSDYQRAKRRADEISGLGWQPRIDDRKRAGSIYWIDVDLSEPGQGIDSSIFQTDPSKITRLEMRACPPPARG